MLHLGTVNPDAHRRLGQHATVHTRNSVLRPLIRATQQGTATSRKIEVKTGTEQITASILEEVVVDNAAQRLTTPKR